MLYEVITLEDEPVVAAVRDDIVVHEVGAVVDIGRSPADIDDDEGVGDIEALIDIRQGAVDDIGGGEYLVLSEGVELLDILLAHDVGLVEVGEVVLERLFVDMERIGDDVVEYDEVVDRSFEVV